MMKGIDVAKWNGNIDWNKVKATILYFYGKLSKAVQINPTVSR